MMHLEATIGMVSWNVVLLYRSSYCSRFAACRDRRRPSLRDYTALCFCFLLEVVFVELLTLQRLFLGDRIVICNDDHPTVWDYF